MAVPSPSRCTAHQLSRSLHPHSALAFRDRSVSGTDARYRWWFFSEPLVPRLVLIRSQTPGTDMFGSRPSTSFDDSEPSIVSPTTSSAIDFLALCRRLKFSTGLLCMILRKSLLFIYELALDLIAIVGDITPSDGVPQKEKSRREWTALNEMCEVLGGAKEIKELWEEYENNSSAEANLVKDFDKYEISLILGHSSTTLSYPPYRKHTVEMILQALVYENEYGKVLDEFFLETAGKFQTEIGKSWAAEIISRRKSRL